MKKAILVCTAALLASTALHAQFSRTGPEWTTAGMDAQRSRSVPADTQITLEHMKQPGFTFLWKQKLGAPGSGQRSYSEPVLVNTFIGYKGFKALAVVGGTDALHAVDYDLGTTYWEKHFDVPGGTASCPAGVAIAPGRLTPLVPPPVTGTGAHGGYHSTVGKPGEGVPLKEVARVPSAPPATPPPAPASTQTAAPANAPAPNGPGIGGASGPGGAPADPGPVTGPVRTGPPPGTGLYKGSQPIFAVSSDGVLHAISQGSAKEIRKPVQFVPAGTGLYDLIDVNDTVYGATVNGCGPASDSVYAIDVSSPVSGPAEAAVSWKSTTGRILGPPAFSSAGTVAVATSQAVVLLQPKTLKVLRTFAQAGPALSSPPVIFTREGKETVAVGSADGRVLLYAVPGADVVPGADAAPNASSPRPGATIASLATWEDADGTRWLVAAAGAQQKGALQAYRIGFDGGKPSLQTAWASKPMPAPGAPIVIDGVLFALAKGHPGLPAQIVALDAATGAELWNSGSSIASYVDSSALSFSPGQIYVTTHDGTLYAFGFPVPRQ